jgi:acyl carrier protein
MLNEPDDVRASVLAIIEEFAAENVAENGDEPQPIVGSAGLVDIGFTSLTLARLLLRLETELGVDPFAEDVVVSDVRTVDELIAAYRNAAVAVSG